MFTIADIDSNPPENLMEQEDEEAASEDEQDIPTYPIRTAITITKVCFWSNFLSNPQ